MIRFDAGALRVVLRQVDVTRASERVAAELSLAAAGAELESAIRANISLTDHTLRDLADLDHPYARRHGSIQIHRESSPLIAVPEARIHTQSGSLLRALSGGLAAGRTAYRVGFDSTIAPHAKFVELGTKTMLPRDVISATAAAPEVKRRMMRAIVTVLGKQLRGKSAVRFGGA